MLRGLQALISHCGLAFALMFAVAFIGVAVVATGMFFVSVLSLNR